MLLFCCVFILKNSSQLFKEPIQTPICNEWNSFFKDIPEPADKRSITQKSGIILGADCYVCGSYFEDFAGTSKGGAIYSYTSNILILIEKTTIINVRTNGLGGGIFVDLCKKIALFNVCGSRCYTIGKNKTERCYFCYISAQNEEESEIFVNDSTVANCRSMENEQVNSFLLGKEYVNGFNSSRNKCRSISGIGLWPYESIAGKVSCILSFSSIANNTAYQCISMFSKAIASTNDGKHSIKYNNIFWNKQGENVNYMGIIDIRRETIIENCCILFNIGGILIYQRNGKFSTLLHCIIDPGFRTNVDFNTEHLPAASFFNYLECYQTAECIAKPDVYYTGNNLEKFKVRAMKVSRLIGVFLVTVRNP